ncbi:MAG: MoaD/ThiS family protein [Actinomycetota bacterium]|nr:MoaD/ThiS family protein [Actinomycetota bacterium]MDH5224468.1 MoaD/ThiS family protein [Actinomycetota bacterium]MDH5313302.1 MoaD/ThiS family protein [Actinomycetota bacterium]
MAKVRLRAPLSQRSGGSGAHDLPGATVGEVLRELERRHPPIVGWILDERGAVRPHVNVFVNGEPTREDAVVEPTDVLQVLPSISGGCV